MISIGEFSKICKVTTRTLRYYDDINLLKPVMVNKENNYRFYDVSQVRTILMINRLKEYEFSLEEIHNLISTNDNDIILNKIIDKKKELQDKINRFEQIKNQMDFDILNLEKGFDLMSFIEEIKVELIETQDMNIISSRQIMNVNEYGKYIGKLFEEVFANKLTILGHPMSIYYGEEFDEEHNDTEVAIPVKEENNLTRNLKGQLCAKTVFNGPYSKLNIAYGKMLEWISKNNYKIIGSPYDKYIKGPADGKEIITEIYFPIKKIG